jgi:dTDP-L-rhamnose 4-epimerase
VIARRAGAPPPTVTGQYRLGDVRAASCEIVAAVRELDWRPRVSLEDGVERLLAWLAEDPNRERYVVENATSSSPARRR